MYKKYKLLGVVLMILFVSFSAYSQVVLPQVFSDNMVLQRNAKVKVWGKSKPKAKVKIQTSWNGKMTIALSDKEGQWQTFLETGEAGGPFEITFDDGDVTKLSNILLGEVWLCSGQSNMNMPMKGWKNQPVANSNQQITMSSNDQIRLFQVKKTRRLVTQPDFNYGENWKMCDPENVAEFSAVAYHFGKMLQEVLDVPIGLIHSSSGGSRIEAWMSSEGVDQVDFVESLDPNMEGDFRNYPTTLYNSMIHPMVGYGMRGVLWYQGEENRLEWENYRELMPALVKDWRALWENEDLPFYYAQIAPFEYDDVNSAFIREVQLKLRDSLPNLGMISLMDVGSALSIHPPNKEKVGQRFAYMALAKTYEKKGIAFSGPIYNRMEVVADTAKLYFDFAEKGLVCSGDSPQHFVVAGEDKVFYPASVLITKEGLSVYSSKVKKPVAVRYGFENYIRGDLFNTFGLPASSFRTDDWEEE